jgi:hypothetical protein
LSNAPFGISKQARRSHDKQQKQRGKENEWALHGDPGKNPVELPELLGNRCILPPARVKGRAVARA